MQIVIGSAAVLAAILLIVALDSRLRVRVYTDRSEKLTKPVCVVLISDLHGTMYGKNQSTLIQKVAQAEPHAVFFAGDMVGRRQDPQPALLLMRQLQEKYSCYYVQGNHEYEQEDIEQLVRECGVTVLNGEERLLELNGQTISLSGVQDPLIGMEQWREQLRRCNAAKEEQYYSILLSHRPTYTEDFIKCSFDLVLCGHTHGGQVQIPGLVNGLFCPDEGWLPRYAGGEYDLSDTTKMIVGRGLIRNVMPRLFNPPELVVVQIQPQ